MSGSTTVTPGGVDAGFNKGWYTNTHTAGVVPAGELNNALSDGSDLTYVFNALALSVPPRAGARFITAGTGLNPTTAIPAGARVRYVQPHVRMSAASSFSLVQEYLAYGWSDAEAASGATVQATKVNQHAAVLAFDLAQRATPPSGNPYWTMDDIASMTFVYAKGAAGAKPSELDTLRLYAVTADIVWDDQPTVTIVSPANGSTVTEQSATLSWTTISDLPQGEYQLRVFTAAQAAMPAFSPETAAAYYEQTFFADWQTVLIPGLDRGVYVVYLRVATLPQGQAYPFWSAWASTTFDVNPALAPGRAFAPPLPPTLVATPEDDRARIRLNLMATTGSPPVPALVGQGTASGTGSLGPLVDWGETPAVDEVLVVHVTAPFGTSPAVPKTGWTQVGGKNNFLLYRRQDGTVGRSGRIFNLWSGPGASNPWTVVSARRFAAVDQGTLLRFASENKENAAQSAANVSTTGLAAVGDLVVAGLSLVTAPSSPPVGNWDGTPDPPPGAAAISEYHVATSAGSQSWQVTWGGTSDWAATMLAFRAAPAPYPAEFLQVQRSLDGGATWGDVRGASRRPLAGDEAVWWDTEVPNHGDVVYRARSINDDSGGDVLSEWSPTTAATYWTTLDQDDPFAPDACVWWLKAPNNPSLDRQVIVIYGSMPTITTPKPRTVHNVLNRVDPVVVRDRRKGAMAPITFGARDAVERARLLELLSWEGTLLLQAPPEATSGAWGSRYVEIGDIVENLPALATVPFDTFTTDLAETGSPTGDVVAFGARYSDITAEVGFATYADLSAAFATYGQLEGWVL